MIVLVCGGRDYSDYKFVCMVLDALPFTPTMVVHGGARGADSLADQWARSKGIHVAKVDALWDTHGKKAGMLRNEAMLSLKPEYVVAFPGGRGTANMNSLATAKGLTVWEP